MEFHFSNVSSNQNPSPSSSSSLHHHLNKKGGKTGKPAAAERAGGRYSSTAMKLSTDPQSVAARERRHRISDRIKILQSMVPGGAKLDTVSVLDEAINYVKFLKAQIWLHQNLMVFFNETTSSPSCSSDDLVGKGLSAGDLAPRCDDDYAPVIDSYSQLLPLSENSWFGSADQETVHWHGFS